MPIFTRRHYELIAETLRPAVERADLYEIETLRRLANDFARHFEIDNPRFNYTRFLRACGIIGAAVRQADSRRTA